MEKLEDEPVQGAGGGNSKAAAAVAEPEQEEENLDIDLGKYSTMTAEKTADVLAKMTPEQMSRYESYRRSGFQKASIKRIVQSVTGVTVSPQMPIVVGGITKIFVGELVETARMVMEERGDSGPIRPTHVREAHRRMKHAGKIPLKERKPLFH